MVECLEIDYTLIYGQTKSVRQKLFWQSKMSLMGMEEYNASLYTQPQDSCDIATQLNSKHQILVSVNLKRTCTAVIMYNVNETKPSLYKPHGCNKFVLSLLYRRYDTILSC